MEEFQPYFYLSHKDIHDPKPGKMVGVLLLLSAVFLVFFKITGATFSWTVILMIFAIGFSSLYLGKIVHHHQNKDDHRKDVEETEEDRKFAY